MKRIIRSSTTAASEFEITEDGVLVKYHGSGGDVVIPNKVTRIGKRAFFSCTSLTSITIPNSVTSIGYSAFFSCTSLTSITVDSNNKNYSSANGVLFNKNKTELIQYPIGNTRTSYSIPNTVTSIGDDAFEYCNSLTSVTIPDSVTSIGDCAFESCSSLTSITIPNSVTYIGDEAFDGCDKLPEDVKNYISQVYGDGVVEYDDDGGDEYDSDEMSFDDWYDSSQGESEGQEFVSKLEILVRSNYNVDDFFAEPSVQGFQGGDFIWVSLADGSRYEFVFDWYEEQHDIYERGPEAAAKSYFQKIQDGIDSGSALAEE